MNHAYENQVSYSMRGCPEQKKKTTPKSEAFEIVVHHALELKNCHCERSVSIQLIIGVWPNRYDIKYHVRRSKTNYI